MNIFYGLIEVEADAQRKLDEFVFKDTDGKYKVSYEMTAKKKTGEDNHEVVTLQLLGPTHTPENEHRSAAVSADVIFYPHLDPSTEVDESNKGFHANGLLALYLDKH